MKFSPTGNQATKESADIWNGLGRHIEQQSNAPAIYDQATNFMVQAGWGYWRVKTDYKNTESFDQEIYIRGVQNQLNVWLDCDALEPDKSDARFGFIIEDCPKDMFDLKYPKFRGALTEQPFDTEDLGWLSENTVRVAEYYRIVYKSDTLWVYTSPGSADPTYIRESLLPKELLARVKADVNSRSRPILLPQMEWYFIVGNKKVDERKDLPGTIIPIVKVSAEEIIIDGKLDCKSHTRAMKDSQRMYNYWASSAVEFGALQTKTPWLASAESIEGYQTDWNSANVANKSVLQYNALADDGTTVLPPPQRIAPPVSAPVSLDGMKIASEEMMTVSGQYQAMLGAPSNERSGKAINERQRQGETATYHYIDAVAMGVRKTAKIVLELAPKIYDTQRVISIIAEDGKSVEVTIDPDAQKAYEERNAEVAAGIQRIFNPQIGSYDVNADTGPSYGSKREDAFNAFMQLLGQAPSLIPILGDFLFQNGDFPMAELAADRLRRLVPPHALGNGPSPEEMAMQQQMANMKTMLGKLLEEKAISDMKLKGKDQSRVIDMFNAITNRLKVVTEDAMSKEEIRGLVKNTLEDVFQTPIDAVGEASEPDLALAAQAGRDQQELPLNQPPLPGQRMGADGQWYARDLSNNNSYRRT